MLNIRVTYASKADIKNSVTLIASLTIRNVENEWKPSGMAETVMIFYHLLDGSTIESI